MQKIDIIKGTKTDIRFTVTDMEGEPLTLTNATVKLQMGLHGADTLKIDGDCEIIDAEAGICKYTFVDGDLNVAQEDYICILNIEYLTGEIISVDGLIIDVIDYGLPI